MLHVAEILDADRNGLKRAAEILRKGGIVAFPTETVYGIGCDATNEEALKRLYRIKGRPLNKPFIVGIWIKEYAEEIAELTEDAKKLIEKFFPGPLTLVLRSKGNLPSILSPEGKIAVRMPAHPAPLGVMEELERPIVVPSANISGRPTLVKFNHVVEEIGSKVDAIIKGDCRVGIESTVVDLTTKPARVLRTGAVSIKDLQRFVDVVVEQKKETYSLTKPAYVFVGENAEKKVIEFAEEMRRRGRRVAVISRRKISDDAFVVGYSVEDYSSKLFQAVRDAESRNPDLIVIEGIEGHEGIMDRLRKIAGERIFRV